MNAHSPGKPDGLLQRFESMSRATRWAIGGGLVIAAYFLVVEPVVDATSRRLSSSESKAAVIASHAKTAQAMQIASEIRAQGVRKFGLVDLPGDPEKRPLEFNQQVDEILKRHGVRESTSTSRTSPLGAGPLAAKITGEFRVDRMMRDIQFAADPDAAAAILADLERNPIVSTISRLQVRQADGRDRNAKMVRVTMTVETWLQARKGKK